MYTSKLRIAALLIPTVLLLAVGSVCLPRGAHTDAAPAPGAPKVPRELLEKRLTEANAAWEMMWDLKRIGRWESVEIPGWSQRLLDAELALAEKQEDRTKALQA